MIWERISVPGRGMGTSEYFVYLGALITKYRCGRPCQIAEKGFSVTPNKKGRTELTSVRPDGRHLTQSRSRYFMWLWPTSVSYIVIASIAHQNFAVKCLCPLSQFSCILLFFSPVYLSYFATKAGTSLKSGRRSRRRSWLQSHQAMRSMAAMVCSS